MTALYKRIFETSGQSAYDDLIRRVSTINEIRKATTRGEDLIICRRPIRSDNINEAVLSALDTQHNRVVIMGLMETFAVD